MSEYIRCPECGQMVYNFARSCPYCHSWVPTTTNLIEGINFSPAEAASFGIVIDLILAVNYFDIGGFLTLGKQIILSVPLAFVLIYLVGKLKYQTQIVLAIVACAWWIPIMIIGILWFFAIFVWALWNS